MAIEIIDGASDGAIADWLADQLNLALDRAGGAPIAISVPGGSTPFPILRDLAARPLAWLSMEFPDKVTEADITLRCWPGDGASELLARAHPHGAWVNWGA